MPAIPKATRFVQPGVVAILFFPTLIDAETFVPSAAEMAAATDLTREVDDVSGWATSTNFVETKDASTPVRPKLAGAVSLEDSSITFNGSKDGQDARSVFTRGQEGYILIADSGLGVGKKADVFPVTVGTVAKIRSLSGDAPYKIRVDFGVTNAPAEDITLVDAA